MLKVCIHGKHTALFIRHWVSVLTHSHTQLGQWPYTSMMLYVPHAFHSLHSFQNNTGSNLAATLDLGKDCGLVKISRSVTELHRLPYVKDVS